MKAFAKGSVLAVAAALSLAGVKEAQAVAVDVELQLLVDVSGSVDSTEFNLQRQGYVDAFNSTAVQDAILDTTGGRIGAIAAQFIYWSGSSEQAIGVDWTLIDSAAAAAQFATDIGNADRPFGGLTAPGNALSFGAPLFTDNGFEGDTLIVDVSGDGAQNDGSDTSTARDSALAGTGGNDAIDRINGLPILGEGGLEDFYTNNIVGGPGAFVLAAASFSDFQAAIEQKLVGEITGEPPTAAVPVPASLIMLLSALGGLGFLGRRKATA